MASCWRFSSLQEGDFCRLCILPLQHLRPVPSSLHLDTLRGNDFPSHPSPKSYLDSRRALSTSSSLSSSPSHPRKVAHSHLSSPTASPLFLKPLQSCKALGGTPLPRTPLPATEQTRKRLAEHSTQAGPTGTPGQGLAATSRFFKAASDTLLLPAGITAPLKVAPLPRGERMAPWDPRQLWD